VDPEKIGCRLQEGVQSCNSGMAKKETLQKKWNPGILWTAEKINRGWNKEDPLCTSGTAQETQS
jgi:hypothetical protein